MKKTILFCSYRDWANKIYQSLKEKYLNEVELIYVSRSQKDKIDSIAKQWGADTIFFVGWGFSIDKKIIKKYDCVSLHPSPLPKYRGGSPIQHQIMGGEKDGAVTLFKVINKEFAGDILYQQEISLGGELTDIFERITSAGIIGFDKIINEVSLGGELFGFSQDESQQSTFQKMKDSESEITTTDLRKNDAEYVYNKIRALQYPYPNVFIKFQDGSKLYIKKSSFSKGKVDEPRTTVGSNKKSTPKKGKTRTTSKLTS